MTAPLLVRTEDAFGQLLDALLPNGDGMVAVIEAYFDETGTHHGSPIMCVAGYLFTSERAKRFNERWGSTLRQAGIQHFRMSECANGAGQFKGWPPKHRDAVAKKMVALIRENMTHGLAVYIKPAEFDRMAPAGWRAYYGGAYTMCLIQCLVTVAVWAKRAGYGGEVTYFFEAGDEHAGEAHAHMTRIVKDPEQAALVRYASHSFVNKRLVRPFDAADFLAWHLNRLYIDSLTREGPAEQHIRPRFRDLTRGVDSDYSILMLTRDTLKTYFAAQKPPPPPPPEAR